jgi:hypothetical protein
MQKGSTNLANALYFRRKAEQCHRLANEILDGRDPVVLELNALAIEFAAQATGLEEYRRCNPDLDMLESWPSAAMPPLSDFSIVT